MCGELRTSGVQEEVERRYWGGRSHDVRVAAIPVDLAATARELARIIAIVRISESGAKSIDCALNRAAGCPSGLKDCRPGIVTWLLRLRRLANRGQSCGRCKPKSDYKRYKQLLFTVTILLGIVDVIRSDRTLCLRCARKPAVHVVDTSLPGELV